MLQGSSAGTWVGIPGDPIAIPTAPDARSRRWPGTPTAPHGASPGCSLPGICSARAGNSGPASAGRGAGGGTGRERLSCSNPQQDCSKQDGVLWPRAQLGSVTPLADTAGGNGMWGPQQHLQRRWGSSTSARQPQRPGDLPQLPHGR